MVYTPTAWVNDVEPAINATNLNKMETGIAEAHDHIVAADDHVMYLLIAGTRAMTGNLDMGSQDIVSAANGTFSGTVQAEHLYSTDDLQVDDSVTVGGHIGLGGSAVSAGHMLLIGTEVFTGTGTKVGIGSFPTFAPSSSAANVLYGIQGNVWLNTKNWGVGSIVNALQFLPAPAADDVGSANLDIVGIVTGGLINIADRVVTAKTITGISVVPVTELWGAGTTTADDVTGVYIRTAVETDGTWGVLTGLRVDPQVTANATVKQGLWMAGDGVGADIVLGAGKDAHIHYDGTDLVLNSALVGSGVLKFGTHTGIGAETVTGYITIKDDGGNSRKLAVVS